MRRSITPFVVLAAMAFGLAACGGDDSDSSGGKAGEYADAIAASFGSDSSEGLDLDDDEKRCLSGALVDAVGVDAMEEAGIEPEDIAKDRDKWQEFGQDLSDEQTGDVVDALFSGDCVDFGELMGKTIVEQSNGALTDEQGKCIGDGFVDGTEFQDFMAKSLVGDESADYSSVFGSVMDVMAACDVDPALIGG